MSKGNSYQEIPDSPGVYQIRCLGNGKIYVGSSVSLCDRWRVHRRDLRRGVHHNTHLQAAWRRYGELKFEFSVLELAKRTELLRAEQRWINFTGCTDSSIGFNVKLEATCAGLGVGRRWVGFYDPQGNPVTICGLMDFCKRQSLDYRSMHRFATGRGKLKSYRGWTHENSVRVRAYIKTHRGFINPSGRRVAAIRNLGAYCRKNGLDATHMIALKKGRIVSYRGWTHVRSKKRLAPLEHKGFIAPGGAATRITNLAAFCRASRLCVVHMHELKSGKRPSHKGWTWSRDADRAFAAFE
jgi:predicted GIY-YIG superfamily endonuclease